MAARYGHCDSFFVQGDDWFEQRRQLRERVRQHHKERQHAIAGELSRVTADEYQDDVLGHLEHMELRTLPDVNSIDSQTEIQWFMRPYLLDFLVEAHAAFNLLPDTLYLAINLLDRYCSKRVVYKRHYQLVGCAALLIASKYGDRKERVPQIKELRAMCCSLYEEDMFTQMEWHLLQTLDWTIGHPTVDAFLQMALSDSSYDPEVEHMAWYLAELALFHREFVAVAPSTMARSALALARYILARPAPQSDGWADAYDAGLVARLYHHLHAPSAVVAKKYSTYQLSAASVTAGVFVDRQARLERQAEAEAAQSALQQSSLLPHTPVSEVPPIGAAAAALHPQTPQKGHFPAALHHGLYTPPITPEADGQAMALALAAQQQSMLGHGSGMPGVRKD